MIGLVLKGENFEYDIYSLVKAFYPEQEAEITGEENKHLYDLCLEVVCQEEEGVINVWKRQECIAREREQMKGSLRQDKKSKLKRMLYHILTKLTEKSLPWGTLTGIRPTKIPFALLEAGDSVSAVEAYMKKNYLVSEEKTSLSIQIAQREREILKQIDYINGYSLYLGIPFCPSRCFYCSFPSYPISVWEKRADEYVEALCKEIRCTAELMDGKRLNTIYIGGGTPTTLRISQMAVLFQELEASFDLSKSLEFTVEAGRPDSITREKLDFIKQHAVTRISVNPQTMKQETLDLIGRQHTVDQIKEAFLLAREAGYDNINMDLIVGLPNETYEDMEHTMKEICALKPDSITIHSLAMKRASRWNEQKESYTQYKSLNNSDITHMMERYAKEIKLMPYYLYRQKNMTGNLENVGYSAVGKEGIYNILIMEEKQTILALGVGATTKIVTNDCINRIENVKSAEQYIDRIDEMIERKKKGIAQWHS